MTSMRRTLLVSLLLGISAVIALAGLATYSAARVEVDALMDYQLRQLALSLRDQQFGHRDADRPLPPPDKALDFVIQIWDDEGVRLYLSHPHKTLPALAKLGYSSVHTSEGEWRAFSVPLLDHVIQVAQPMRVRRQFAADAALRTVLPMLATLPLLGALIWYLVGRGLRPLRRVAGEVVRRRPDALEPLTTERIPEEVKPLVGAINRLLGRLGQALNAQREFVADAAHELRTPLTALQIQLELCERAKDEASRQAALDELSRGLARAGHLVQQLLTLARLEPGVVAPDERRALSLADVARASLADSAAHARRRNIDLGASALDEAVVVHGNADALRTLVGNLVDNAIRYTPAGGRVDVHLESASDDGRESAVTVGRDAGRAVRLIVDDSGPGIPPEERERVLGRFYRHAGNEVSGSGLGLAIVQRIAERHDATLELAESPLGGLRVSVLFPPSSPSAGS